MHKPGSMQWRHSPVPDNSAYLGDISPGARATARYALTVDGAAALQTYNLDTEIRYRDTFDNSQISNTFPVAVQVVARPAYAGIIQILPLVAVVAIVLIGAGYYVLIMRKKK